MMTNNINMWRQRIIDSCGDAKVTRQETKHVDPALCLYVGAPLICVMDNDCLDEAVPRGNGTTCRLVSVKIKPNATTHRIKKYHEREVWTVNAKDVEFIECELNDNRDNLNQLEQNLELLQNQQGPSDQIHKLLQQIQSEKRKRTFRIEAKTGEAEIKCRPNRFTKVESEFKAQVTQFPINLAKAVTGHKLQGRTMDTVVVTSWPKIATMKNWEYTVLSRVKTINGLYLFEELDLEKSYAATEQLKLFLKRMREKEEALIINRESNMAANVDESSDYSIIQ